MNQLREIRRARLIEAIGLRCNDTPARAAKMLGVEPSYINDLLHSPTKSFGEKAARKIEAGLGLDAGFLDRTAAPTESKHTTTKRRTADIIAQKVKRLDESAQLSILTIIETMINIADPGYWKHVANLRQRADDRDRAHHVAKSSKP